jgi:hypothetical protein
MEEHRGANLIPYSAIMDMYVPTGNIKAISVKSLHINQAVPRDVCNASRNIGMTNNQTITIFSPECLRIKKLKINQC